MESYGAVLVLDRRTRRLFPFLEKIFADGADGGEKLRKAMAGAAWTIAVVKRSDAAKDWENLNRNVLGFLKLASIRLMLRKLCNPS